MTGTGAGTESLLRALAPQALGALVRRSGNFAEAEDAVQEALVAAAATWPEDGEPHDPLAWLIRVASRRLVDQFRRDDARRRREAIAASWSRADPDFTTGRDDTLILTFMCCHPSLTPASAIALTLRAVGGLSTREIATAFLVPEATMAQRISRAKARIKAAGATFSLPGTEERAERVGCVLQVLYLLFNEGYATSAGPDLARADLSGEAIGLARAVRHGLPEDPEVAGLLALMLLTDARRPARTGPDGELVPLEAQDRTRWDRARIAEGLALVTEALDRGRVGPYQLQAAIAALHDQAGRYEDTDWVEILTLYGHLEQMTGNPMVALNRAVALAMVHGPDAGLEVVDSLRDRLGEHHRRYAVRAHLLELAGDPAAAGEYRAAADRTANLRERNYLTTRAALAAHPRPER